ncbi:TetR/AcrR family transcriptional regulator [Nocardia uniformis]|uniref:TetR/AcrR family transcriptional regulator n=1 Tax=Nocardia uniformis TaxID=53432 RepID=A0A849BZE1_9NOCA|nr:TetR/AcrR family transcriptional regulator [Nocardia uniformis]NNH70668.1 TetR/AcrR family transcriptional regulator [Nocardia uniformis]
MTSPDARELILLAGERLIADSGCAVSLRDIAVAANQRNNSAVHYHFGSRDGLIAAIVERRQQALDADRMALLSEHDDATTPDTPAPLLAILVRPMFDTPYAEGSTHYARFLEQVRTHPVISAIDLHGERWPATKMTVQRLHRSLTDFPAALRAQRLRAMSTVMFALLADYERRRFSGASHGLPDVEDDILAMLTGLLTAPDPAAARTH